MQEEHESYGMIQIAKFTGNVQFFGSDLNHNGGVSIIISKGSKKRDLSSDWYHATEDLIEVNLSYNQFVDAITSGMNTSGVPCTLKYVNGKRVPQIDHVEDKKVKFSSEMSDMQTRYANRIDNILEMLDGNIGKRKVAEIKHEIGILRDHIGSNTNFVMKRFNEEMEDKITEAKHTIANYVDHKIHTFGLEHMRKEFQPLLEDKSLDNDDVDE